jgi:hypothetical protein
MTVIAGAMGKSQSGKTTLMAELVKDLKPLIVVDTDGELSFLGEPAHSVDDAREMWNNKKFKIVIDAEDWGDYEIEEANDFVRELLAKGQGKIDFNYYITEIWEYAGRNRFPQIEDKNFKSGFRPSTLRWLIKRGRKRGLSLWWDSQRPSETNTLIPSQSTDMYIFEQWGHDVEYLRLFLKKKLDWEPLLDGLKKYEYMHVYDTPMKLDVCPPIHATVDLHKSRVREDNGPAIDIMKEFEGGNDSG